MDYLDPYRRHLEPSKDGTGGCSHRDKGRDFTLCDCPIWVYGRLNGEPYRRSIQTNDWERAKRRIDTLLRSPNDAAILPAAAPRTVAAAVKSYLADCVKRSLRPSTLKSYTDTLDDFVELGGVRPIAELDVDLIAAFRDGRDVTPRTQRKEIEHLRAFCAFAMTRKWLADNPAKQIKPAKVDGVATLPFTREEFDKLLTACDQMQAAWKEEVAYVRHRARALVWALVYSGLRVGDVAQLRRAQLEPSGHLVLRVEKTGVPLKVLLHPDAVRDLSSLPAIGGSTKYFFWTGKGKTTTIAGSLRRTIDRLGKIAEVHAHPHRFRDTFAVELLTNGADIRTVQKLLGHQSIRTTELHYAHFVKAHQALLDSATATLDFRPKPARPLLVKPLKNRRRNA
jgi:integrase/recombinase XerD